MKLFAKFALVVFALAFSLNLFAAQKSVTLYTNSTLNGQKVPAGDYKVDYQINGSTAEVKLLKNGKAVASATGEVVPTEDPFSETAIVRSDGSEGSSIVELQLAHQKSVIRFAPAGADKGK